MATSFDLLEAVASMSGTTGKIAYETGTVQDTVLNAQNILGNIKNWNVMRDEAGNVISIIGKNGQYVNFPSPAGVSEVFAAGNQLPTDVIYDVGQKTIEVVTGNVTDQTQGGIVKKGLTAAASKGAQVLSGVTAALGGVLTGVNWYKDNPDFWTEVSQKLLPFAYDDPTDKSWGDILWDALMPAAVDSDGKTYVPYNTAQEIYNQLQEANFFTGLTTRSVAEQISGMPEYLVGVKLPVYNLNAMDCIYTSQYDYEVHVGTNADRGLSAYRFILFEDQRAHPGAYARTVGQFFCSENEFKYYPLNATSPPSNSASKAVLNSKTVYYGGSSAQISYNIDGIENYPAITLVPNTSVYTISKNFNVGEHDMTLTIRWLSYIALFGNEETQSQYDNTSIVPGATYPAAGSDIKTQYPDWYGQAVTTVNPNFDPSKPESDDNQKYITWLPVQFPDSNADSGNTNPGGTPEDAQSGKPLPNDNTGTNTDTAINDNVLPDPNPDTDPSGEGSSGNTGGTPDPDKGNTPDVPVISGGNANALWKIYNPSISILQEFGRWLWSTNWLDLVKQLFANNPSEGIIGLHMIYVTPPTGGTSNIIVGYLDSGVASPWVSQQYVTIDCGSVSIPLRYNSALDYGYTKVYCYLPFIGIVPLDSFDIVGKTVNIKYTVDVLTGTVLAQIAVSAEGYYAVLYTFNGSCSVEYPLSAGSRASQMLSLITGAVGGAVVGGVGGAILGGSRGAATGADVRMSGNLAGNAGAMGIRKPYIIVKRPVEVAARDYNSFYGYPANTTVKLSSVKGYCRVKDVHVEDITIATADEKAEIESLLKSGVIVS